MLGDDAMRRGVERIMLERGPPRAAGRLRRLSRRLRERGDPRAGIEAFRRAREHRFLDVVRAASGAIALRGQLDASDGELLLAALAAHRRRATANLTAPAVWRPPTPAARVAA